MLQNSGYSRAIGLKQYNVVKCEQNAIFRYLRLTTLAWREEKREMSNQNKHKYFNIQNG